MFRLALLITLAISFFSFSAHADWQETRWGMTAEQVKAAMKGPNIHWEGDCPTVPSEKRSFSFRMEYTAGVFAMQGCADGSEGIGLNFVHLSLKDFDQADALKAELLKKYGAPFLEEKFNGDRMTKLEWHQGPDIITFSFGVLLYNNTVSKIASVTYAPLITASSKGL